MSDIASELAFFLGMFVALLLPILDRISQRIAALFMKDEFGFHVELQDKELKRRLDRIDTFLQLPDSFMGRKND